MVFVVKLDVARVFFSDRNVWHFESPSNSDRSTFVPMPVYSRELWIRQMNRPAERRRVLVPRSAATNNRLILVSDVLTQRSAHNLIKLRIGN
jgi:hypothetical protein